MKTNKLIIGYQDTPQGHDALALGELLAETLDARPLAATVPLIATVLPWSRQLMSESELEAALRLETKEPFAAVRDRLAALDPETKAIASHSPGAALYELAGEERALLIVVGSTHRGPLGRVLPGSVGRALLQGGAVRGRRRPARLRRPRAAPAAADRGRLRRFGRGLGGVRDRGRARRAHARDPHRDHGGRARALRPCGRGLDPRQRRVSRPRARGKATRPRPRDRPGARRFAGRRASAQRLARAAARRGERGVRSDARRGSRGYGALKRTALGNVAGHLVDSAACPVLVLPRGVGMDPLRVGPEGKRVASADRAALGRA